MDMASQGLALRKEVEVAKVRAPLLVWMTKDTVLEFQSCVNCDSPSEQLLRMPWCFTQLHRNEVDYFVRD